MKFATPQIVMLRLRNRRLNKFKTIKSTRKSIDSSKNTSVSSSAANSKPASPTRLNSQVLKTLLKSVQKPIIKRSARIAEKKRTLRVIQKPASPTKSFATVPRLRSHMTVVLRQGNTIKRQVDQTPIEMMA